MSMTLLMSLSPTQRTALKRSVATGLQVLSQPEPMSCVEWADENFYLSSESSYSEGKWVTSAFQVAPLNAMGNDDIDVVNMIKSARVGYTKMILASIGYNSEHKKRNQLLWQPTDAAAAGFMKQHVETCLRDVPVLKALSPWLGQKHRDSTLDYKRFANRKQLFIYGGASAKNYREKSVDNVYYDELSSFEPDIEKEGDARTLGDKRVEGSIYPKSIRGSTPKSLPECQITQAADESEHYFRRSVPCPHCKDEQFLVFGGKDEPHGLKFKYEKARKNKKVVTKAYYVCEHCACIINNNDLAWMDERGRYISESGVWTKDGIAFFDKKNKKIETPKNITFHIWTIFSPWSPWKKIAQDFLDKKSNPVKLKAFINTTLGEAWTERGETVDHESLYMRREHYPAKVPMDAFVLVCGVDVQDDRLEATVYGTNGQQIWCITHDIWRGDPGKLELWEKLDNFLLKSFEHESGLRLKIAATGVDTGGHYTTQAYKFCKARENRNVYALKGSSTRGSPLVSRPSKSNAQKVELYKVGTDTAKEFIFGCLRIQKVGVNYVHFPMNEPAVDEEFFKQLCAEERKTKYKNGFPIKVYEPIRSRNEALDCFVYALAALEILRPLYKKIWSAISQKTEPKEPVKPESPTSTKAINKQRRTARKGRKKSSYVKGY